MLKEKYSAGNKYHMMTDILCGRSEVVMSEHHASIYAHESPIRSVQMPSVLRKNTLQSKEKKGSEFGQFCFGVCLSYKRNVCLAINHTGYSRRTEADGSRHLSSSYCTADKCMSAFEGG